METHSTDAENQQRLISTQEKHLEDWIVTQEAFGLGPTHMQIKVFAERILASSGDRRPLGKHWIQAFLRRHPAIGTNEKRWIDSQRLNGATAQVINSWFEKLFLPEVQAI